MIGRLRSNEWRRPYSVWRGSRKGFFERSTMAPHSVRCGGVATYGRSVECLEHFDHFSWRQGDPPPCDCPKFYSLTRGEANVLIELGVTTYDEWLAELWVTTILDLEPSHQRRCELFGYVLNSTNADLIDALRAVAEVDPSGDAVISLIDSHRELFPDYLEYARD